jgi:hypothetical protein
MGIRKILFRKELKLLTLLLTSLLIASASAAVYYSMIMQPSVTIAGAKIVFVQGSDWPSGSSMGTNSTWVSLALKAYPNATLTYDEPLNLSNTDATNDHEFRLRHVSITPATGSASVGNFTSIKFIVKNAAGVTQVSFDYTTTGDTWNTPSTTSYMTLPAGTKWIISVETKAVAGALSNIAADIQIAVDVQE